VARALAGFWRASPLPVSLGEELVNLLCAGGAGGLVWWRVADSSPAESALWTPLQDEHRKNGFSRLFQDHDLPSLAQQLRAAGVEFLWGKGGVAARLYPGAGLRPCGDIDLYVSPAQFETAMRVKDAWEGRTDIDLHKGASDLSDLGFSTLRGRAQTLEVGGEVLYAFSREDHLRLLCLHALRHGVVRPIQLCDIALILATQPDLDWSRVLSGSARRTEWVRAALWLAHRLLGAPRVAAAREAPGWVLGSVLALWGSVFIPRTPLPSPFREPRTFWGLLPDHWPGPVESAVGLGASFSHPPLALSVAEFLRRSFAFGGRLLGPGRVAGPT
jgi:hypothetical protein